jgi:hypothetical protein
VTSTLREVRFNDLSDDFFQVPVKGMNGFCKRKKAAES